MGLEVRGEHDIDNAVDQLGFDLVTRGFVTPQKLRGAQVVTRVERERSRLARRLGRRDSVQRHDPTIAIAS